MLKVARLLCLFLLVSLTPAVFAHSVIMSADSFSEVEQLIASANHPHHLLVALDDDDTLTMMPCPPYSVGTPATAQCQYLGGPAWFSWQQSLPAGDPQRVWQTFPQLIAIQNLLFSMSAMPLDDAAIPDAMKTVGQVGAHLIVATARGYNMIDNTEAQLTQDGILNTVEGLALHTKPHGKQISFPAYYMPKPWSTSPVRSIAYENGILYLAGQNKGIMLQQFLKKTHQTHRIQEIIFVDDTMQNVTDVAAAYQNDPNVYVISVHYTRLEAHKDALTIGKDAPALQAIATNEWKNIEAPIKSNLTGSNF